MFTEHKIGAFAAKVGDLADVPRMAPAALKAQFDAAPEELRASLNGVCDDGAALDTKVEGIVAQTFVGAIHESMLDAPLGAKLSGKAEKTALTAEETARKSADAALQTTLGTQITAKCELTVGTYTGTATSDSDTHEHAIALGFRPKAVLLFTQSGETWNKIMMGGLALDGFPVISYAAWGIQITANGFSVRSDDRHFIRCNASNIVYHYCALR